MSEPMLDILPSKKILKTTAFAQSLKFVACMRTTLSLLSVAPSLSLLVPLSLMLLTNSSNVYFTLSLLAFFFSLMSFNRNWSFVIGTLTSDMPLIIGLPHFTMMVLNGVYAITQPDAFPTHAKHLHRAIETGVYGLPVAAFLLSTFSTFIAIYHLHTSIRARTATRNALSAAGYDVSSFPPGLGLFPFALSPFATTRRTPAAVICKKDVEYAAIKNVGAVAPILERFKDEDGTLHLSADIYYHPTCVGANPPVLLYVHGGAWFLGAKDLGVIMPLIDRAAKDGYVVMSVDYRLCPAAKFPDMVVDVKSAIKYIRTGDMAKSLGFDVDSATVVLAGDSAGGHINNLVALSQNDPFFQPGFEDVDTSVQGFIDMFGPSDGRFTHEDIFSEIVIQKRYKGNEEVADIKEDMERVSPICYDLTKTFGAKKEDIRWLHFHGTKDGLVPIEENRRYYGKIFDALGETVTNWESMGARKVVHVELQGSFHGFCGFLTMKTMAFCDAVTVVLEDIKMNREGGRRVEDVNVHIN